MNINNKVNIICNSGFTMSFITSACSSIYSAASSVCSTFYSAAVKINPIASVVSEKLSLMKPIKSIAIIWQGSLDLLRYYLPKNNIEDLRKAIIPEDRISSSVNYKIKAILKSCGIEPHTVIVRLSDKETGVQIFQGNNHYFYVNRNSFKQMEKEFTDEHRFIISHEAGHIFAKDSLKTPGLYLRSGLLELLCYSTIVSLAVKCSGLNLYLIPVHILASKVADFVTVNFLKKKKVQQEIDADLFAAKQGIHIGAAGKLAIQKCREENLKALEDANKTIQQYYKYIDSVYYDNLLRHDDSLTSTNSTINKIHILKIQMKRGYDKFLNYLNEKRINGEVSKEGNILIDDDHPPLTEREAYLSKFIEQKQ